MQQRVITIVLLIGLFFGLLSLGSGMMSWRLPDREQGYAPVQPIDYSHRLHAGELGIDCRFCHWAAYRGRYAGIPSTDICMKCHDVVTMTWGQFQAFQEAAEKEKEAAQADGQPDSKAPDSKAPDSTTTSKAPARTKGTGKKRATEGNAAVAEQESGKTAKSGAAAAKATKPVSATEIDPQENKLLPLYESLGLDADAKPVAGKQAHPIPWVRVHNLPDFVYFDHSVHMAVGISCQQCHGPVESMERVRQFESLSMGWCITCHRDSTKNGVNGRVVNAPTNCTACHY